MLYVLLVFILSFLQSFIATQEIHSISRTAPISASMWAFFNSSISYVILIILIVRTDRIPLVIADIIADVAATYVALKWVKHGSERNQ